MAKNKGKSCSFHNLITQNIDLKLLIEDTKLGNDFNGLSKDAYEDLWNFLLVFISPIIKKERSELDEATLYETLVLLERALQIDPARAGNCLAFYHVLSVLSVNMELNENCKSSLCKINEIWLKSDFSPISNMAKFTLESLLAQLNKKITAADVKRLYSLRVHFTADMIETQQLSLNSLIVNPAFVGIDFGQKFLAYAFSLSNPLVQFLFNTIKFELRSCSKKNAENYGAIMLMTWNSACDDIKPFVKDKFQDMMEAFIKVKRLSLELPPYGRNLMIVISGWNVEVRHKSNNNFINMMTECYQPIIWRYLQSGINFERCNATDLFMKAFPMQTPGDPASDTALFIKQFEQMEELLRDSCHIVRIIAVREICNILAVYWTQFTAKQIISLLSIILNEHAIDSSSFDVRKTVWRSLKSFISSEPAFEYIKQLLPNLGDYFNDVNQRVRVEFIELLIAIREKKDPNLRYSHVVSTANLLKLLAHENITVGSVIVKLLLPNCYISGLEPTRWIQKFCWLITTYRESYRNFFMYSKNALPFDDAYLIMCELMMHIGGYIKKKVDSSEETENDENNSSIGNVSRTSMYDQNKSVVEAGEAANAFDRPEIVVGIFDIIGILWLVHSKSLLSPDNKSKLKKLHELFMQFAPSFISYYKGSDLFQCVLELSGNVPAPILNAGSITLPGLCMNRLKTMKIECSPQENEEKEVMLRALASWDRSGMILEQILLWLQDAFHVRETPMAKTVKRVKIKETIAPNPELAVHLLDLLLQRQLTKDKIFRKHESLLWEVWVTMNPIKESVFRRLLQGRPFSNSLQTDAFLTSCFRRYVKLIPLLHRESPVKDKDAMDDDIPAIDVQAEYVELLRWMKDDILPMLQSEEFPDLPLLVSIINDVLYVGDNIIMIQLGNEEIYEKLVSTITVLISLEHKLPFVKAASRVAVALNFGARVQLRTPTAEYLWAYMVPRVYFSTLDAMLARPYSSDELAPYKKDFQVVKTSIGKILKTYSENFQHVSKTKNDLGYLEMIAMKTVQSVRLALAQNIPNEQMQVTVYSSISELNLALGTTLSGFYNDHFWSPMFLNVLKQNLGQTVKILLADIIILYLFAHCENKKWRSNVFTVMEAALIQLKKLKHGRNSCKRQSLGITINHADNLEDNNEVGNEAVELPSSQITSAAGMSSRTNSGTRGSAIDTNMDTGIRESAIDTNMATGTRGSSALDTDMDTGIRESAIDTNMATGTRGSSALDTDMDTGTRESAIDTNMATGTRSSDMNTEMDIDTVELRISQPMDCNDGLSQPLTQSSQPLSNVASQGSQPTQPTVVPLTPKSAEKMKHILDEEDTTDDLILCGEGLLDSIKTFITSIEVIRNNSK